MAPVGSDQGYLDVTAAGLPVVFVDREPVGHDSDVIHHDDAAGVRLAVEHLIEHGHRRIAFTGDSSDLPTTRERLRVHREVLREHGLDCRPEFERLGVVDERTADEAIRAYKLGLYFAEQLGWPLQKQAGYRMGMAWVYRDTEEHEKEEESLRRAAELYEKSVMKEHYPINGMTDNMAMYIAGAAYYRIGDFEKATQMLSRLMGDQELRKSDAKLFERAQNLWLDLREKKAEAEKEN